MTVIAATLTIPRISIHAPREGGDLTMISPSRLPSLISIHAPREGGDRVAW